MLEQPSRTVSVYPFSGEYAPIQNIPVTSAGTVYVDPITGQQALLILQECLYFGDGYRIPC
jgi:hypothetical protein